MRVAFSVLFVLLPVLASAQEKGRRLPAGPICNLPAEI
jgi:hypothetical protein